MDMLNLQILIAYSTAILSKHMYIHVLFTYNASTDTVFTII